MSTQGPAVTRRGAFVIPWGWSPMVELDGDLTRRTWTVAEAAAAAGVGRDVIYQWKRRGKLIPVNPGQGRPRFRAIDVLKTEAATRERAHRGPQLHAA